MHKNRYLVRNICIGLVDGIIIPLALASGLSIIVQSSDTIFVSSLVVAFAGAITMTFSAYVEGKKHEPQHANKFSALLVGFGYLLGGVAVASPFFFIIHPFQAFRYAALISFVLLLLTGYTESKVHGVSGWVGATRAVITASAAVAAAYFISKWFF